MKILRRGNSGNVIDNRGRSVGALGAAGGGGIILAIIGVLLSGVLGGGGGGFDFSQYINQLPANQVQNPSGVATPDPDADMVEFVSAVFDDIQATWEQDFAASGKGAYQPSKLVLFTAQTPSGCGTAPSSVGPFYCPADSQVYIDLDFFDELESRFGAPGDFAIAYVIAHEVGHHIQNLTGVNDEVARLSQEDPDRANELSVRTELQADCFAGVWGNTALNRGLLEPGDLEEGLNAAAAVGDDRLTGSSNSDNFTHGTSEQRGRWFRVGFDSGRPSSCDTFGVDEV